VGQFKSRSLGLDDAARRPSNRIRPRLGGIPVAKLTATRATYRTKARHPTPAMVSTMIRIAEESDQVMAAAMAMAFVTSGRRGELCALRWSDVDRDVGTSLSSAH
jgi:integrase